MPNALVIVESPAKAKTIKKYLGSGYSVLASVGHIMDLPPSDLGVDVDKDFEPRYVVIRGKAKVLKKITDAAKGVDDVYLAPDPDREGEAIAWHIAQHIRKSVKGKAKGGKKGDAKAESGPRIHRARFNEITARAIKEAIGTPVELDLHLFEAQQARRILDRLVGYRLSPLLWEKVRRGLSAGRVQSVAVRIVCEREDEIGRFVSQEYWSVVADMEGSLPPPFEAKLVKIDGKDASIAEGESATRVVEELKQQTFKLAAIRKSERRRNPAPPFTTSKLQQEAARKLGFTAKKTMTLAQMLYEGVEIGDEGSVGLISYMRTDSTRVSDAAIAEVREFISGRFGAELLPETPNIYKSKRGAQDAHEAVRPTSLAYPPERVESYLERDALRLYDLIWKRFVASQMRPAIYDQTAFDIAAGRFLLRATGQVLRFPGFIAVYIEGEDEVSEKDEEENPTLPLLTEGETLKLLQIEPHQHFTQPPPRFTEASLVKELEEKGIGRPSTYASIMSVIQDKGYVAKQEGRFSPIAARKAGQRPAGGQLPRDPRRGLHRADGGRAGRGGGGAARLGGDAARVLRPLRGGALACAREHAQRQARAGGDEDPLREVREHDGDQVGAPRRVPGLLHLSGVPHDQGVHARHRWYHHGGGGAEDRRALRPLRRADGAQARPLRRVPRVHQLPRVQGDQVDQHGCRLPGVRQGSAGAEALQARQGLLRLRPLSGMQVRALGQAHRRSLPAVRFDRAGGEGGAQGWRGIDRLPEQGMRLYVEGRVTIS